MVSTLFSVQAQPFLLALALILLRPNYMQTVSAMTLGQATQLIQSCVHQMNSRYRKVVFDEWAIISLEENKGRLLNYVGPRREGFQKNFLNDAGSLRTGMFAKDYDPGHFEFERHGVGTGFEAFMVLGQGLYLICNNTVQSMDTIAKDPQWLAAQVPFVELSEQVCTEPVSLEG